MKKILITGKNSYIGNSFKNFMLSNYTDEYLIDSISVKEDEWRNISFEQYDVVLHVAGIAHVSTKGSMEDLYYKVNRDLAIEVGKKAKSDGVKQFIFMSSAIVYGKDNKINKFIPITKDTKPNPTDFYGKSKLEAEIGLNELNSNSFKVVCIRTPMVFGPGCKGNFPKLVSMSKKLFVFPNVKNIRSAIYIDNLVNFIKCIIINDDSGIFCPQNNEYLSTKDIYVLTRRSINKKPRLTRLFNLNLIVVSFFTNYINKVFGNKYYDKELSKYSEEYCTFDLEKAIQKYIIYNDVEV